MPSFFDELTFRDFFSCLLDVPQSIIAYVSPTCLHLTDINKIGISSLVAEAVTVRYYITFVIGVATVDHAQEVVHTNLRKS